MILDRLAAGMTLLADLVRGAPVATRERVRLAGAGTPSTVVHAMAVCAEPSDDIAGLEFRSIAASASPLRSRAKGASAAVAEDALLQMPLATANRGRTIDATGGTGPFEFGAGFVVNEGNRVFVGEGGRGDLVDGGLKIIDAIGKTHGEGFKIIQTSADALFEVQTCGIRQSAGGLERPGHFGDGAGAAGILKF